MSNYAEVAPKGVRRVVILQEPYSTGQLVYLDGKLWHAGHWALPPRAQRFIGALVGLAPTCLTIPSGAIGLYWEDQPQTLQGALDKWGLEL